MARSSILRALFIGLLWHLGTWQIFAASSVISIGSIDRRSSKNGRPILAMANSPRCIYNGKPVEDGRQVSSPEPCLNCTCSKGVLLCYLHTCPSVVVPSSECYVAREEGHCCPEVFCKVPTGSASQSGIKTKVSQPEAQYQRSDDPVLSKKRTTPENVDSVGLLPVLLKRNHNKASSEVQTTLPPGSDEPLGSFTPDYFQSNHRPGGTVRDRPHYKGRSTTAVTTESAQNLATDSRVMSPTHVPDVQKQSPEEEQPDKIVYDLRLGIPQNSTKSKTNNSSKNTSTTCYVGGYIYVEGMAMLSTSKCEYCYCIRGHQMCVRPKCHLKIDGCEARYHSGFTCCPSHYHCETASNKTSADLIDKYSTKIKTPPTQPSTNKGSGCLVDGRVFSLGVAVPSRGHCQTCYCTQVGIVCRRLECAPRVDGCEPIVPDGHCCPKEYSCGVPGSNNSEGLVSHSTDNYEVTVFSPQSPSKIPEWNHSSSAPGSLSVGEGNSTIIENSKDGQKVMIHLKGSSQLEKVSILPNENLAILVVTTEETNESNKEQVEVTRVSEIPSKKNRPNRTSPVPLPTALEHSSSLEHESFSMTTASGSKGKVTSYSPYDVSSTQASIERVSKQTEGTSHFSSSGSVSIGNEYYYDDDYDYNQDYSYDYRKPSKQATTVSGKLNEPSSLLTFVTFSGEDEIAFGETLNQKKRRPNSTTQGQEILVPSTSELHTTRRTIPPHILYYSTPAYSSISRNTPEDFDHKPSKTNINNHKLSSDNKSNSKVNLENKVQATIFGQPGESPYYETSATPDVSEHITEDGDSSAFQESIIPSEAIEVLDRGNIVSSSISTIKRQSPVLPKFTHQIPNTGHTPSFHDYRHPGISTTHSFNRKGFPTQDPSSAVTEDTFQLPTRARRPIPTRAPGVKRPQVTVGYPSSAEVSTKNEHHSEAAQESTGIKIVNNALPKDIAELLWSLTESTTENQYNDDDDDDTSFVVGSTSSVLQELDTFNPTVDDAQEIVASPKLILQSSTGKKDYHGAQINPTTGVPIVDINNHDPPQIVFSNHRPFLGKRPLPSSHPPQVLANVNNHKNSHTSFGASSRLKTTTLEPLLEFSNHKPITSTSFRPQFVNQNHDSGYYRPSGDAFKHRYPPHKLHRVIPENESFKEDELDDDHTESDEEDLHTDSAESQEETLKPEDILFGIRTSFKPFGKSQSGSKVTASMRWNDASTNPVTVGFDVKPNIYETESDMKVTEDKQDKFSTFTTTISSFYDKDTADESLPPALYNAQEGERQTTSKLVSQGNNGDVSSKEIDHTVTNPENNAAHSTILSTTLAESSPSKYNVNTEVDVESTSSAFSTESSFSEDSLYYTGKPNHETKDLNPSLEFRNNAYLAKESGDATEERESTKIYITVVTPTTTVESATNTDKQDKENSGSQMFTYPSKEEPTEYSKESTKVGSHFHQFNTPPSDIGPGNETKLYRAEEGSKDPESSFIDTLIPFASNHGQRIPPVRSHPGMPERKTTTAAPQVTPAEEKEIGDVCFVDGRFYKSGEMIVKTNPCEICRCFYGHPLCQVQQCPPPPAPSCILEYLPGYCCPRVTCGVKLDGLRPPSEVNSIFTAPNDVRPPPITMDNQWKPVESPRPGLVAGAQRNITGNENVSADDSQRNQMSISEKENVGDLSNSESEMNAAHDQLQVTSSPNNNNSEESLGSKQSDAESDDSTSSPPSDDSLSNSQPKPVFDPNSIKKVGTDKKDSKDPPAIHDNSSGVRKILDEAVILPPSKMSVASQATAVVNPILPSINIRPTSAAQSQANHTAAAAPSVDYIISSGADGLPTELGGNLKVSGCNVYGKYYRINDKVSALSKSCNECICSPEGITCNSVC